MLETLIQISYRYGGQVAFALSPIAAYLPQYWTVCREWKTRKKEEQAVVGMTPVDGDDSPLLETNQRSVVREKKEDGGGSDNVGFSSFSILILLMAHVLRLEYFYGCHVIQISQANLSSYKSLFSDSSLHIPILQKSLRNMRDNMRSLHNPMDTPSNSDGEWTTNRIQYDLLAQSLVMIAMQILLLSVNIRVQNHNHRRGPGISFKKQKKKHSLSFGDLNMAETHVVTTPETPIIHTLFHGTKRRKQSTTTLESSTTNTTRDEYTPTAATATTKSKMSHPSLARCTSSSSFQDDDVLLYSASPSKNIYHYNTSYEKEEVEDSHPRIVSSSWSSSLFSLFYFPCQKMGSWQTMNQFFIFFLAFILTSILLCHYVFFTIRKGLHLLCTISILLESSLALPTLYLNFQRRDTRGLSLFMVVGWILGDVLKLFYFTFPSTPTSSTGIFIWGCILAITMDTLVCIQIFFWYPTRDVMDIKDSLCRIYKRQEFVK